MESIKKEFLKKRKNELQIIARNANLTKWSGLNKNELIEKIISNCSEPELRKLLGYNVDFSFTSDNDKSLNLANRANEKQLEEIELAKRGNKLTLYGIIIAIFLGLPAYFILFKNEVSKNSSGEELKGNEETMVIKNEIELRSILKKSKGEIKLGILNFVDLKLNKNIYNRIYSDKLNTLSKKDSLLLISVPIEISSKSILTKNEIDTIIQKYGFDIIVWGKIHDKDCSDKDYYCVNYRSSINSLENTLYPKNKLTQEFRLGNFEDFLSGKFSGSLNSILYYSSAITYSSKGKYKKSLQIIERNKKSNIEDNNFKFWKAFNYVHLDSLDKAISVYKNILQDTFSQCDRYYLSSLSNLADIYLDKGNDHLNLQYNLLALKIFESCSSSDQDLLPVLYNYIALSYFSIEEIDSSSTYHIKTLELINKGIGYKNDLPVILSNMAVFNIKIGNYKFASEQSLMGIELLEEDNLDELHATLYYHLGLSRKKIGDVSGGILALRMSKQILEKRGELYTEASIATLTELGWSALPIKDDSILLDIKEVLDSIFQTSNLSNINQFRYFEFIAAYNSFIKSNNLGAAKFYELALQAAQRLPYNNKKLVMVTYKNLYQVYEILEEEERYIYYKNKYEEIINKITRPLSPAVQYKR